ncbi:hypothetical protein ACQRBK_07820 [Peptoniphilaceae bacterium SGI.137]
MTAKRPNTASTSYAVIMDFVDIAKGGTVFHAGDAYDVSGVTDTRIKELITAKVIEEIGGTNGANRRGKSSVTSQKQ